MLEKDKRNLVVSFTVIELIMVIAIIGILAITAIPRFKVHSQIKVEGGAKKLASDIKYVQTAAISGHIDVRIVFDIVNDNYRVEYYDFNSSSWRPLQDPFTRGDMGMDFQTDYQYGGIEISEVDFEGTHTLRFNWRGTPQSSGGSDLSSPGTVILTYKGESVVIEVTPQTGKVSIY